MPGPLLKQRAVPASLRCHPVMHMVGQSGSLTIIAVTIPFAEGSMPGLLSGRVAQPCVLIPGAGIMLLPPMQPVCGFGRAAACAGAAATAVADPAAASARNNRLML